MENAERLSMLVNRVVTVKTNETFLWGDGTSTLISSNVTEINGEIAEPTTKHLRQVMEVLHEQDKRANDRLNTVKDTAAKERKINMVALTFAGGLGGLVLVGGMLVEKPSDRDAGNFAITAGSAAILAAAGGYGASKFNPRKAQLGEAKDFAATISLRRDRIMKQLAPDAVQADRE